MKFMKIAKNPISLKTSIAANVLRLRILFWSASLGLALGASSARAQVFNILPNPDWAPSTPGGSDGGRDWNFTPNAVPTDDFLDEGDPGVTNGSLGILVVSVLGGVQDFEYASSTWSTASPGQVWTASINAANQGLNGTQLGVVAVAFADSSTNIIDGATNAVITPSSSDTYQSGSVTETAPAGTAYVQILVGLDDPATTNSGATIWMADASLSSPGIAAAFISLDTNYYTPGLIPFTVTLSQGANNTSPVAVTVSNSNPGILTLPDEVGGVVTLTFAAGATNSQIIIADYVTNGMDTLTTGGVDIISNSVTVNDTLETNSLARTLYAQYAPGLPIDGTGAAWANLSSSTFYMDTSVNNNTNVDPYDTNSIYPGDVYPGNFGVDVRYAWDYTYLYILITEDTSLGATEATELEATSPTNYQSTPWAFDSIEFWMDLSDSSGKVIDGQTNNRDQGNADFQPWFGFSSEGISNMCFARANNTGNEDLASLAHARSFTSGTWANHNRKIEAAIEWADIAGSVYTGWQPEGNIAAAVKPGLTIGSQPLLTYNAYWVVQTFIGYGNYWGGPSGTDTNSLNVQLIVGDLSPIPVSASIHSGQLVLSWPSGLGAVSGFSLLTSPVLGHGAHWSVVSTAPAPVGSLYEVTLPAGPGPGFYKLVNLQRQWFFTIGGNL